MERPNEVSFNPDDVIRVEWIGLGPNTDPLVPLATGYQSTEPMFCIVIRHTDPHGCQLQLTGLLPLRVLASVHAQIEHMLTRFTLPERETFASYVYATRDEIAEVIALNEAIDSSAEQNTEDGGTENAPGLGD